MDGQAGTTPHHVRGTDPAAIGFQRRHKFVHLFPFDKRFAGVFFHMLPLIISIDRQVAMSTLIEGKIEPVLIKIIVGVRAFIGVMGGL